MSIWLWRHYYRLVQFFKPDDAWERDISYSKSYLPVFIVAIAIGVIMLALAWRPYERWMIDSAIEDWRFHDAGLHAPPGHD